MTRAHEREVFKSESSTELLSELQALLHDSVRKGLDGGERGRPPNATTQDTAGVWT